MSNTFCGWITKAQPLLFLLLLPCNHDYITLTPEAHFRTKQDQWWATRKVIAWLWISVIEWHHSHMNQNFAVLVFSFICFPVSSRYSCIVFIPWSPFDFLRMTLRLLIPGVGHLCTSLSRSVTWSLCESSSDTMRLWLKKTPAIGQVSSAISWNSTYPAIQAWILMVALFYKKRSHLPTLCNSFHLLLFIDIIVSDDCCCWGANVLVVYESL